MVTLRRRVHTLTALWADGVRALVYGTQHTGSADAGRLDVG